MKLDTIYKRTSTGKTQHWTIEIENEKYRTLSGQVGGKSPTPSKWTICKSKNIGQANETTAKAQALKKATAKRRLKLEGEYKESEDELDEGVGHVLPMLAKDYKEHTDKVVFPVFSQRKYNGMRCVVTKDGMFSRHGKPIVAAPHIEKQLIALFKIYPDMVIDGELYSHEYRHKLNRILSLVKKQKPTAAELKESEELAELHVYDGYNFDNITKDSLYSVRFPNLWDLIKSLKSDSIWNVETHTINNQKDLDKYYGKYLEEEYEGQMIRLDAPYHNKRTDALLKRKEFIDKEFEIADITEGEGNRSGTAGRIWCKLDDGRTFKSNIKGDTEYITKVLVDKNDYIGKLATVKFFAYSEYGVPLFPVVTALDRAAAEGEEKPKKKKVTRKLKV